MDPATLWAKIKVVGGNLLVWLMAAQMALSFMLANDVLGEWPEFLKYATLGLAMVSGAITFIRRVTPVPADERGLLDETKNAAPTWPRPKRRYEDPYKDPSPWA